MAFGSTLGTSSFAALAKLTKAKWRARKVESCRLDELLVAGRNEGEVLLLSLVEGVEPPPSGPAGTPPSAFPLPGGASSGRPVPADVSNPAGGAQLLEPPGSHRSAISES